MKRIAAAVLGLVLSGQFAVCAAGGLQTLDVVEVKASHLDLTGVADTATEGTVTAKQLANRPLLRPAEVLEVVPGLIISQHSGDGKANQYYLRGFNLDHGTDFATRLMGMPINMPSHAHGQGYSDLQFLVPELVERMQYQKGPYTAENGDFSAAGSTRIDYFRRLPQDFASVTVGSHGYRRGLVAGSPEWGDGRLLYGFEWLGNDGPWQVAEGLHKLNGILRYSRGTASDGYALTAMAYDSHWHATDQVPQRAIASGLIARYDSVDPSDGGKTQRYSLSGEWARGDDSSQTRASAYFIRSTLSLYSNFEYNLSFPVGDQFEQSERRRVTGFDASHTWYGKWSGRDMENSLGVQGRLDDIDPVGLYRTVGQQRVTKLDYDGRLWPATVRQDAVRQSSIALYAANHLSWNDKFRSIVGLRADFYRFRVDSSNPQNSGRAADHIFSPKLALIFGPWQRTEYYINAGYGFHSNDARGATLKVDPNDPTQAVPPVTPLVRAKGYEIGLRSSPWPGLQTSLALWRLDLASELVFSGDAGTTNPSFPSRRSGIEWANYWTPSRGVTVDADFALSRARYTAINTSQVAGDYIPGAIEKTLSLGLSWDGGGPWSAGARLRYFGPRPLVEDNAVRSASSTLVNAHLAYRWNRQWQTALDVLNLFNRPVSDIDYYYTSRLATEAAPVADIHSHPAEPRSLRLTLRMNF